MELANALKLELCLTFISLSHKTYPPHPSSSPASSQPADIKAAAAILGYNQEMWDEDEEPDECDEYWKDLTKEQQEAAAKLGFDEESWNKED